MELLYLIYIFFANRVNFFAGRRKKFEIIGFSVSYSGALW